MSVGAVPCINDQQFFISSSALLFDDADLFCRNLGGDLVSFENSDEFQAVANFADGSTIWTGLNDDGQSGNGIFSRFSFTDGSDTDFINGVIGQFPWELNQPNNNNNNDNCVLMNSNGLLVDANCETFRFALCIVPCEGLDPGLAGDCINNEQFLLSALDGDFDQANIFCQNAAGQLVSFEDQVEFEALADFGQAGWTGLFDDGQSGSGEFTRFSFTDGSSTSFINTGVVGQFPWASGQPNDNLDNDDCVVINAGGRIADAPCDGDRRAICSVPCTLAPTLSPTLPEPTMSPTQNPTTNPTTNPTQNPTQNPTGIPTSSPTLNPTLAPTSSPTQNPTMSPTSTPTDRPSPSPTEFPTLSPTPPTISPTESPTISNDLTLTEIATFAGPPAGCCVLIILTILLVSWYRRFHKLKVEIAVLKMDKKKYESQGPLPEDLDLGFGVDDEEKEDKRGKSVVLYSRVIPKDADISSKSKETVETPVDVTIIQVEDDPEEIDV